MSFQAKVVGFMSSHRSQHALRMRTVEKEKRNKCLREAATDAHTRPAALIYDRQVMPKL